MIEARRTIPRRVEVVFHVGVGGEELSVAIESGVEDIADAGREDLEIFAVGRDALDDSTRREDVAHEPASVRHAREEVIFAPNRRHG